jgi:hypothetical protein
MVKKQDTQFDMQRATDDIERLRREKEYLI